MRVCKSNGKTKGKNGSVDRNRCSNNFYGNICLLYMEMISIILNYLGPIGTKAGFESKKVDNAEGFARDMIVYPYVLICKKYGYPELT